MSISVDRMLAQAAKESREWGSRARPSFKGGISVVGQLVSRSAIGPLTLQLSSSVNEDYEYFVDRSFEKSYQPAFGLEAYAFLGSRWVVGGGLTYTSYDFVSDRTQETIAFDLKLKSKAVYAFARYLLRPEVGMRPYLLAGGGLVQIDKGNTEASAYGNFPGQASPVYEYEMSLEGSSGTQARAGFGVEYISCAKCGFVVGSEITLARNFLDRDLLSPWQAVLGVRIGFYI